MNLWNRAYLVLLVFLATTGLVAEQAQFSKMNRHQMIQDRLAALENLSAEDLQKLEEQVDFLSKTNCRSSLLEFKVQCYLESAPDICTNSASEDQCLSAVDTLVAARLSQGDYISAREQLKIMRRPAGVDNSYEHEMWARYAELATRFRLSKQLVCFDSKLTCFAQSVDDFCRAEADQARQSWQACSSALILFVHGQAPELIKLPEPAPEIADTPETPEKIESSDLEKSGVDKKSSSNPTDESKPKILEMHETEATDNDALATTATKSEAEATEGETSEETQPKFEVEEEEPLLIGLYYLDINSKEKDQSWVARALSTSSRRILSGYENLSPFPDYDNKLSDCEDRECLFAGLKKDVPTILIEGDVDDHFLKLRIYDVESKKLIETTDYRLDYDPELTRFKIAIFKLIRPFTKHGGIIDQAQARIGLHAFSEDPKELAAQLVKLWPEENPHPYVLLAIEILLRYYPLLGGLIWGWITLKLLQWLFPSIYRFEVLIQRMIPSLLKSWLLLSFWRLLVLASLFGPFLAAAFYLRSYWPLSSGLYWTLLVPVCFVVAIFAIAVITEAVIRKLDRHLIASKANRKQNIHLAVSRYFKEYLDKNEVSLDPRLLKRTIFVAHKEDTIESYGGALSPVRIAIGSELLHLALGDVDAPPPEPLQVKESVPVVFEEDEDAEIEQPDPDDPEKLKIRQNKKLKTNFMKWEKFKELKSFKPFEVEAQGEKGLAVDEVEPTQPEKPVDDVEDHDPDFVRYIDHSTEHYRDFLYGAILAEMGAAHSRNSLFRVLNLILSRILTGGPQFIKKLTLRFQLIKRLNFSRFPTLINDSFAASSQGIPHLMQFLHFRIFKNTDILSSNASRAELWKHNEYCMDEVQDWGLEEEDRYSNHATHRNRFEWLSMYISSQPRQAKNLSLSIRFLRWTAVAALLALIGFKFYEAQQYAEVYDARIAAQVQEIEDAKSKKEKRDAAMPKPIGE